MFSCFEIVFFYTMLTYIYPAYPSLYHQHLLVGWSSFLFVTLSFMHSVFSFSSFIIRLMVTEFCVDLFSPSFSSTFSSSRMWFWNGLYTLSSYWLFPPLYRVFSPVCSYLAWFGSHLGICILRLLQPLFCSFHLLVAYSVYKLYTFCFPRYFMSIFHIKQLSGSCNILLLYTYIFLLLNISGCVTFLKYVWCMKCGNGGWNKIMFINHWISVFIHKCIIWSHLSLLLTHTPSIMTRKGWEGERKKKTWGNNRINDARNLSRLLISSFILPSYT